MEMLAGAALLPLRPDAAESKGMTTVSSEQDIRPALATYQGFIGLVKWGTIGSALVAAIVVLLIAR